MQNIRIPIIISILLHLVIFAFLFVHFSAKPQPINNANIVQAVAVSETQLQAASTQSTPTLPQKPTLLPKQEIRQIEQTALKQPKIPIEKPQPLAPRPIPTPPIPDPPVAADELAPPDIKIDNKAIQLAAKQKKAEQKKQIEDKRKQEIKSHEEELERKRREEETKQLTKELGIETKATTAKSEAPSEDASPAESADDGVPSELSAEKKALAAQMTAAGDAAEVDKYKQMIVQWIGRKWLMPETEDKTLACQLLVHLGPGGIVLDVEIIKESGDANLDRSARNAILKASPLPVPEKTELFDNFRSLRLIFRPQGIISS
jgi:colicin import membrane protein